MIESLLYSLLSSSAPITALAGNRIFPLVLPEGSSLPAVEYGIVASSATPTFTTTGTQRYRVEINCWGTTYGSAVSLRAAVIASLNGYTDGNTSIQYLSSRDLFEHELLQYRALCEFYLMHTNF